MFHTGNKDNELDLPEDSVYIYKDDRNYGRQSLLKHNNGVHNYTLHEIDFVSKRLGKDVGITFNKEILMNGTNDLIVVIKSALMDSREEFTADTSVKKNFDLCEKAIKKGLIDLMSCPEAKLSAIHRSQRIESGSLLPSVVSIKNMKPKAKSKPVSHPIVIPAVIPAVNNDINDTLSISDSESSAISINNDILSEISYTEQDENQVNDQYNSNLDINFEVQVRDDDIEDRKRRTVILMDYLHKTIVGDPNNILPNEVLTLLESIFK
jgi:hypothetical protein